VATYATITEARDIYGDDYIAVSADREPFESALIRASDRIWDIAQAYFPDGRPTVAEAPAAWTMYCIDIAVYFSSATSGPRTEEKRQRYDDAIDLLQDKYPPPETEETSAPSASLGARVSTETSDRVFTREKMSGLL
jgi:phage gp36-like protein